MFKKKAKTPKREPVFHLSGIKITIIGEKPGGDAMEHVLSTKKDVWFNDGDTLRLDYHSTFWGEKK